MSVELKACGFECKKCAVGNFSQCDLAMGQYRKRVSDEAIKNAKPTLAVSFADMLKSKGYVVID